MPTNASRSNFELEKYFFDLGTNVGKVDRHLTRRSPSLRLPPPATRGPRQGCIASEHLQERERREGTVRPDKLSTIRCQIFSFKKKKNRNYRSSSSSMRCIHNIQYIIIGVICRVHLTRNGPSVYDGSC